MIGAYSEVSADMREVDLITRKSIWIAGREYWPGIGSDEYLDVIKYGSNWYRCIVHHLSSTTFTTDINAGYWKAISWLESVATDLLLSRKILADEIDAESLVAKRLRTAVSGARVEIEGSLMTFFGQFSKNIEIGVDSSGYAVLTYYGNDGSKLYDLGPHGLDWGSIKPASWSPANAYCISLNASDSPTYEDFNNLRSDNLSPVGAGFNYYAGSNPVLTPEEKEKEAYTYKQKSITGGYLADGWYCRGSEYPFQYNPSAEEKAAGVVMKKDSWMMQFGWDSISLWATVILIRPIYKIVGGKVIPTTIKSFVYSFRPNNS